jgi:hypothetical protein
MIKTLKNITNGTLSITLFGHVYEIPVGWSLSAEEVWGGEETLRYIAAKFADKVRAFDAEGQEVEAVECPGCGNEIEMGHQDK